MSGRSGVRFNEPPERLTSRATPQRAPERMRRYVATLDLDNPADHAKLVTVYSDVMQDIGEWSRHGGDYDDLKPLKARWLDTLTGPGLRSIRGPSS